MNFRSSDSYYCLPVAVDTKNLRDFKERVKELTLLHRIVNILQNRQDIPQTLKMVARILPSGWQYPEIAVSRIVFDGVEYTTPDFVKTRWGQSVNFVTCNGKSGSVEIYYLEEKPEEDEGPFLAEERNLIVSVSEMLRLYLDFRDAEDDVRSQSEHFSLLAKEKEKLEKSVEIYKVLTGAVLEGMSVENIVKKVCALVKVPVVLEDRFFNNLAYALPDGSGWDESVLDFKGKVDGKVLSEILGSVNEGGRPCQVRACPEKSIFSTRIIAPIVAEREIMGYLSLVTDEKEITNLDLVVLEHAATALALELLHEKISFISEQKVNRDILNLISGDLPDGEVLTKAQFLGYDLLKFRCVMAMFFSKEHRKVSSKSELEQYARVAQKVLKEMASESFLVIHGNIIIVFLAVNNSTLATEKTSFSEKDIILKYADILHEKMKKLTNSPVSIGIGSSCRGIKELRISFKESLDVVKTMMALGKEDIVMPYFDLGLVSFLCRFVGNHEVEKFVKKHLEPVLEYDARYGACLLNTLKAYFENRQRLLPTASACSIHTSTLTYRLKKIEQLCSVDMNNPDDCLSLNLAIKLYSIFSRS